MKKLLLVTILGMFVFGAEAQDRKDFRNDQEVRTLFGNVRPNGGFVSATAKSFYLNKQWGYGGGGEVAVVMGRKFNIGFSAYGLGTDVFAPYQDLNGSSYFYELGYGGLFIEPMIGSVWPIHVSFPVTLGMGGVTQSKYRFYDDFYDPIGPNSDGDLFLIADLGANVELNVFKFLRLAGGINYRFTSDVYLIGGGPQQLSGFGGNVSVKLGWF